MSALPHTGILPNSTYSAREPGLIRPPHEGYHQTVFLNPEALDYVSFPTHKVGGPYRKL